MASVIEVMLECVTPEDGGRQYYRVVARMGSTGENPQRNILFDGLDYERARQCMIRAMRDARDGNRDAITAAFPRNREAGGTIQ